MSIVQRPPLSVYVAAASGELARAKTFMTALRELGITVTSTWTDVIEQVGAANPMGAPQVDRAAWAQDDLDQVAKAQVLCLLLPPAGEATIGAWVELGFALALGGTAARPILVVGEERAIFTALANHRLPDDAAALNALKTLALLHGMHADA